MSAIDTLTDRAQRIYCEHNPGTLPAEVRRLLLQDVPAVRRQVSDLEAEIARLRQLLDPLTAAARWVVKCEYDDFNDALEELDDAFRAAEHGAPAAPDQDQDHRP